MKEEIKFLKELQDIMKYENEHDYDCQASPRFWTVGDYKWMPCWEGHAEKYIIFLPDRGVDYDYEEFKNQLFEEDNLDLDEEILSELRDTNDIDDLLYWVQEHLDSEAYIVPMKKEHIIRPDTMFLTKEEAKSHIKKNHYHYSDKAHTYAMTAWRAPKVEKLLRILSDFDWDSIEVKDTTKK